MTLQTTVTCCGAARGLRDASAARSKILISARRCFIQRGYDDVTLREIAAGAGLDAALIGRYFGNKEQLFGTVLRSCSALSNLFEIDRTAFSKRIAEQLVYGPGDDVDLDPLFIAARSHGSLKAKAIIEATFRQLDMKLAGWIGGADCEISARLLVGLIVGLEMSRPLVGTVSDQGRVVLRRKLEHALQAVIGDRPAE